MSACVVTACALLALLAHPATAATAAPRPLHAHAKHAAVAAKPAERTGSATGVGARTLQDIHIEGEIPTPQVLFITARDQRRFLEFQHQRYLRTSRMLGADTALPSRIVVPPAAPVTPKETSR